jgi:hypothetical protein
MRIKALVALSLPALVLACGSSSDSEEDLGEARGACWPPIPSLTVTKTALAEYRSEYDFKVEKTGSADSLTLSTGQTYMVDYAVRVDLAGKTDSDWKVSGTVTVANSGDVWVRVTEVKDTFLPTMQDWALACRDPLPPLWPRRAFACTYAVDLAEPLNGTNKAEAAGISSGRLVQGAGTAEVNFTQATVVVDECAEVSDSFAGYLGKVCAGAVPQVFTYSRQIGPYGECGEYQVPNTALIVESDSGEESSDSWTVTVTVPCSGGCTLTQGYWKTHSEYGPAPYDDNWANLADGANTPFFLSGMSYYEVLWTPPQGNAYFILAHQYIAAELNTLNGAAPDAVTDALAAAEALFQASTPDQVAALRGRAGKEQRAQFTDLAGVLDDYNSGLIGPGHCSE